MRDSSFLKPGLCCPELAWNDRNMQDCWGAYLNCVLGGTFDTTYTYNTFKTLDNILEHFKFNVKHSVSSVSFGAYHLQIYDEIVIYY